MHADAKLADYDWDALASAATLLDPAPTRLTAQLDRADCLARHAHLERRERDLDNAKQVRTARAVIGPGKRSSAALLHQLDPLKDGFLASILSLNQPARGQSLLLHFPRKPYTVGAHRASLRQANSCRSGSSRSHSAPSRSNSSSRTHAATPSPSSSFTYRPPRSLKINSKIGSPSEPYSVRYTPSSQINAGSLPDSTICLQASKSRCSAPSRTDLTTSGSKPPST